jgi:hypothetical protein
MQIDREKQTGHGLDKELNSFVPLFEAVNKDWDERLCRLESKREVLQREVDALVSKRGVYISPSQKLRLWAFKLLLMDRERGYVMEARRLETSLDQLNSEYLLKYMDTKREQEQLTVLMQPSFKDYLTGLLETRVRDHEQLSESIRDAKARKEALGIELREKQSTLVFTEKRVQDILAAFEEKERIAHLGDQRFLVFFKEMLNRRLGGDYLNLHQEAKVVSHLYRYGDDKALFSDFVQKVNRRNVTNKRIMVLSNRHLYLLHPESPFDIHETLTIASITAVCLSSRRTDLIIFRRTSNTADIFLYVAKRHELLFRLIIAYESFTDKPLNFIIGESFGLVGVDNNHNSTVRDVNVDQAGVVSTGRAAVPVYSVSHLQPNHPPVT